MNGEIIEGAINKIFVVKKNGKYSLQVTGTNACVSEITDEIDIVVGVEDVEYDAANINIYPNPVEDVLNIEFKNDCVKKAKILISDVLGRTIYCKNIDKGFCIIRDRIYINNIYNGIYLINIYFSDMIISKKIIVQH